MARRPRSNWNIPEPTYRWRVINGGVVAETMGICMIRSTRPREPGLYEVFGQAFNDLAKGEQA